jgi:hypothetical protein
MAETTAQLQERCFSRLHEAVLGGLAVSPNVSLATPRIHNGKPKSHAFEAWLDVPPQEGLRVVRIFSGAGRLHSRNITANGSLSGSIAAPQELSQPCLGAAFESEARVVPDSEYRRAIFIDWLNRELFTEEELAKYLDPDPKAAHSGVPPHEVYEGEVTEWSMMDSVSQETNPEAPRLFLWGGDGDSCPLPQDGTLHQTDSPHLHLPLPWAA